jgi:hypothetical protein
MIYMETINAINTLQQDNIKMDRLAFQKTMFIMNALENGWTVKKKHDKYVFVKKNENRQEVYQEEYLRKFIETNMKI